MNRRRNRRKGMSLLEVIIALAVFLISITGLVFLMGIASDNALEAQMRSQAMSICQSRLAEASCGALPLSGTGMAPCEDDGDYQWSMDVDPGSFDGLFNVTVHVSRKRANGTQLECSLCQMILDPQKIGTVFDGAKDLQSSSSSDSTTDSSSSGTSPAASSPAASSPAKSTTSPATTPKTTTTTTPKTTTAPKSGSKTGS